MAKSLPACLFVKGCFQGSAVGSLRRQTVLRVKEIITSQALLHCFGFRIKYKIILKEKKKEKRRIKTSTPIPSKQPADWK